MHSFFSIICALSSLWYTLFLPYNMLLSSLRFWGGCVLWLLVFLICIFPQLFSKSEITSERIILVTESFSIMHYPLVNPCQKVGGAYDHDLSPSVCQKICLEYNSKINKESQFHNHTIVPTITSKRGTQKP